MLRVAPIYVWPANIENVLHIDVMKSKPYQPSISIYWIIESRNKQYIHDIARPHARVVQKKTVLGPVEVSTNLDEGQELW